MLLSLLPALLAIPVLPTDWRAAQEARFSPPQDGLNADKFGHAVSVSNGTIAVGAPFDFHNGQTWIGTASVFVRDGTEWSRQAVLIGRDSRGNDKFGSDVALEGDVLVVGALGADYGSLISPGAAYVFERAGSEWEQVAKITPADARQFGNFGEAVTISGDTIVVGAPGPSAVYAFVRTGPSWGQWTQQAKLAVPDYLGDDIELRGDTLVVGTPSESSFAFHNGAVAVFERAAGTWSAPIVLRASNPTLGEEFGSGVSVFGDTIAVGAPTRMSTYVFDRNASGWQQAARLFASDYDPTLPSSSFGRSVALFGRTLVVGAQNALVPNGAAQTAAGAAYVFERAATWSQLHKIVAGEPPEFFDKFGSAASFDGETIVVGAEFDTGGQGAAHAFRVAWPSSCFGDGSLATPCPCNAPDAVPNPSGAPRSGCANSFDLRGARLIARGITEPDVVGFQAEIGAGYGGFAMLVKSDGRSASGVASGDGIRCVDGSVVRFGSHNAGTHGDALGDWSYPNAVQTTPVALATAQSAGQTALYQLLYRDAGRAFCSPGTVNWSNAVRVDW